jgi:hypothetical protein
MNKEHCIFHLTENMKLSRNGGLPVSLQKEFTKLALEVIPGDSGFNMRRIEYEKALSKKQLCYFNTSIMSGNSHPSMWANAYIPHEREGVISNQLNEVHHSAIRGSGNIKQQNLAIAAPMFMRREYKKMGELRKKYEDLGEKGQDYPLKRQKAVMQGNVNPDNFWFQTDPGTGLSIVTRRYGDQNTHVVLMNAKPIDCKYGCLRLNGQNCFFVRAYVNRYWLEYSDHLPTKYTVKGGLDMLSASVPDEALITLLKWKGVSDLSYSVPPLVAPDKRKRSKGRRKKRRH